MQQTLLIQIFRREQGELGGRLLQGEGECPTCHAFSTQCCQEVEGLQVFQEVQESNSIHFWNLPFLKAVLGLKYQVSLQFTNVWIWFPKIHYPGWIRHGGGGVLGWIVSMISDFVQSFQEMIIHDFTFLFNPMITPPPLFLVQFLII